MSRAVAVLFGVAGVINALPLVGVLGADQLEALYGMPFADPDLIVLMRHRAVLFGLVAGLLFAAAVKPPLRMTAGVVGLGSMLAYLWLTWREPAR